MPNFSVDWHSHNIPHWRRILERYRGQPKVRALEIGSFEGRSTIWLLENILTHETAHIDCIDTFKGSVEHERMVSTSIICSVDSWTTPSRTRRRSNAS